MNVPVPAPSEVLLSVIVGVALVELQQTPLAVTGSPPSAVTDPPEVAELEVMLVAAVNVTVGMTLGLSFLQVMMAVARNPVRITTIRKVWVLIFQVLGFMSVGFYLSLIKITDFIKLSNSCLKRDNQCITAVISTGTPALIVLSQILASLGWHFYPEPPNGKLAYP